MSYKVWGSLIIIPIYSCRLMWRVWLVGHDFKIGGTNATPVVSVEVSTTLHASLGGLKKKLTNE